MNKFEGTVQFMKNDLSRRHYGNTKERFFASLRMTMGILLRMTMGILLRMTMGILLSGHLGSTETYYSRMTIG